MLQLLFTVLLTLHFMEASATGRFYNSLNIKPIQKLNVADTTTGRRVGNAIIINNSYIVL